jgi:uncharacterized glyoxalase superfamily protein PhnB
MPGQPARYHTITPSLTVRDATKMIEFYKQAFGAKLEGEPHRTPDGKVMHAEMKIGDSVFMFAEEFPDWGMLSPLGHDGKTGATFHVYTDDVDATYDRAVKAGATAVMPVADQFWGDRYGIVTDPSGHRWGLATHIRDVSEEELREATKKG